jgi:hypothetical protein
LVLVPPTIAPPWPSSGSCLWWGSTEGTVSATHDQRRGKRNDEIHLANGTKQGSGYGDSRDSDSESRDSGWQQRKRGGSGSGSGTAAAAGGGSAKGGNSNAKLSSDGANHSKQNRGDKIRAGLSNGGDGGATGAVRSGTCTHITHHVGEHAP